MAPQIEDFYKGKNVFITGGTGFLGAALIEKLLRTMPDLGTVYLLMRPKRGKDISERLEEIKKNSVFEKLYESRDVADVFKRVQAVAGDVGQKDLGLSPSDRQLLIDNVNVVFHSAATLDFEATLKPTIEINLLGTRRVVELCSQIKDLKVLVHVSSAYVNSWRLHAEEVIYPLNADPEEVINLMNTLSEQALEEMTPKLLGDHPNTYTFTKQMAEHEVQKVQEKFPCAIVRPSMITGVWQDPMPGWTTSKNGPQGFLMGASKGVIRRLPVGKELVYDYIPVDTVVNNLIVAGCYASTNNVKKVEVYQCTSSTRKPFRWSSVEPYINTYLHHYPLKSAVWYPYLKFLPSVTWYRISAFFVHIIPALILDTVTKVAGGRPILMRLHRNVNSSLGRLEKFIFTEWEFPAVRSLELHNWMTPADQKKFNLDISTLSWPEYFQELTKGVRKYLNKEPIKNLAGAKSKDSILFVLHMILQASIVGLVWYVFSLISGLSCMSSAFIIPVFYFFFNLL